MLVVHLYNGYDFLSLSTLTGSLSVWALFTFCEHYSLLWRLLSIIWTNFLECLIGVSVVLWIVQAIRSIFNSTPFKTGIII
jgi:hypothetical protein